MSRLSDITITHISLVKAGANKKSIIYKSNDKEPNFNKEIEFKKSDDEKGLVYGIVYSPMQVDTQGDFASADEIVKAAYSFMKERNTLNVDKNHDFKNVEAFVAESWIVKENDSVFPAEPVGSWAVVIKLESDELRKAVKSGEIAGISMAGTALKKEEQTNPQGEKKEEKKSLLLEELVEMFRKVFGQKESEKNKEPENKELEDKELENKEIEKALNEVALPLKKELALLKAKNEELEKSNKEMIEALKKSKQNNNPAPKAEKEDKIKGIL